MAIDKKIAFLGGGNMAEALIKGMLAAGVAQAGRILVSDVSNERLELLRGPPRHAGDTGPREAVGNPCQLRRTMILRRFCCGSSGR